MRPFNCRAAWLVGLLVLAGCATSRGSGEGIPANGTPIVLDRTGPDLATEPNFNAQAEAHRFDHAADCEIEARSILQQNPNRAWALLRACVDRGDFTDLHVLLDGAWDAQLRKRPDAGQMLTRLIAARGGDIEGDVAILHDHRVPVFTLADALSEPQVYAGRLVIMRARVSDFRMAGGKPTVELDEYTHDNSLVYAPVGPGYSHTRSIHHSDREAGATEHHHTRIHDQSNRVEQRMTDTDMPTGREALGKLEKPDPFLEPNEDFVILARFDGVRELAQADEGGSSKLAVVTVLNYFRPGDLSLY